MLVGVLRGRSTRAEAFQQQPRIHPIVASDVTRTCTSSAGQHDVHTQHPRDDSALNLQLHTRVVGHAVREVQPSGVVHDHAVEVRLELVHVRYRGLAAVAGLQSDGVSTAGPKVGGRQVLHHRPHGLVQGHRRHDDAALHQVHYYRREQETVETIRRTKEALATEERLHIVADVQHGHGTVNSSRC